MCSSVNNIKLAEGIGGSDVAFSRGGWILYMIRQVAYLGAATNNDMKELLSSVRGWKRARRQNSFRKIALLCTKILLAPWRKVDLSANSRVGLY